jgi:anti-sigma B factor antagonist
MTDLGGIDADVRLLPSREGPTVIVLEGEFDLYTGARFERAVLEAIGRGATDLVVDMSNVSFIDSTTMEILMRTRKRLSALGGDFALVCGESNVLRALQITTLDRMFDVYGSREQAVAALDGSGPSQSA